MNIIEPASRGPLNFGLGGVLALLLCQPVVAMAQASTASSHPAGAEPSALGTGTAPPSAGIAIPEPAMAASAPAMSASAPPLNNAHADFAPNDPPGEWHSQARDYANTRYSPLDQITAANVAKLRVAWSFSDGTRGPGLLVP